MSTDVQKDGLHRIVCQNIKKYRKRAGLTQEELSEKIDMSYDYLRRLESERGQKDFSFFTLYKISLALNVPMDTFVIEQ